MTDTDTITIKRSEYERLRNLEEDILDVAAYDRAIARLASGEDESVPAEFANRILDGENTVRVYRDLRGFTQQALSQLSGVNRVQIAEIEANRATGSVETLRKLANALGVTLDDIA